jgi:hypothetical protein
MSIFKTPKTESPESPDGPIPITPIDLSKRYDIYCSFVTEDRLYEDVRIAGIRTFARETKFSSGLIGGYIEIEARDGTRVMIPHIHIRILCEHGSQPAYKVLRSRMQPKVEGDHDA